MKAFNKMRRHKHMKLANKYHVQRYIKPRLGDTVRSGEMMVRFKVNCKRISGTHKSIYYEDETHYSQNKYNKYKRFTKIS